MTEAEALQLIHGLPRFHRAPGLERIQRLLHALGDPQKKTRFIHVAGTNGKGSTCTMTAAVLRAAGYRTGLYISPYILNFRERMQVNGEMIPPEQLAEITEKIRPEVERMIEEDAAPAEFELVTAIALEWFAQKQCDVVVLEVGLGGRLDATNAIDTPLASVICTIDFDHTELLGNTLPQIAGEKCGIIKPDGLTVAYPQPEEVRNVIEKTAAEQRNRCVIADPAEATVQKMTLDGTDFVFRGQTYHLPLLGAHQVRNAVTVLTLFESLRETGRWSVPVAAMQQGLSRVHFPARLEIMGTQPTVLLDGAHNPSGIESLCAAVRQYLPGGPRIAVIGMLRDKDYETAVRPLAGMFSRILTLTPASPRALPAEELAGVLRKFSGRAIACGDPREAIREACAMAGTDGAVVICGSLYLAAQLRELLTESE